MSGVDPELEGLKDRSWKQWAAIDAALESGEIDEAGWFRAVGEHLVPAYIGADDPRGQSGYTGDEQRWEGARRLLLDAVDRGGAFLDVGCANGHLLECLVAWASEDGIDLEPWGLEISVELATLARERLPAWADRVCVGNALHWEPPRRFDYVRTNLDYVPARRRPELVRHLLDAVVAPDGRLIVGVYTEELEEEGTRQELESWDISVAGSTERPHPDSARAVRRALWIDGPLR